jgi:hypothetical protein
VVLTSLPLAGAALKDSAEAIEAIYETPKDNLKRGANSLIQINEAGGLAI